MKVLGNRTIRCKDTLGLSGRLQALHPSLSLAAGSVALSADAPWEHRAGEESLFPSVHAGAAPPCAAPVIHGARL